MLGRVDFPEFLDAQGVSLRVAALIELEFGNQLATQMAACAFGKHRVFAQQFHTELKIVGRLAVLADAHVAGGHALDGTIVVVQHFGGRKAGEDFHAQIFRLRGQPARDVAQADDVIAIVVKALGHQKIGRSGRAGLAQK